MTNLDAIINTINSAAILIVAVALIIHLRTKH